METLAQETAVTTAIEANQEHAAKIAGNKLFDLTWQAKQFESARFGWMAILLTLQSCVGAIACMFVSIDASAVIPLALGAAVTMGSNALFIALAPARVCLAGLYISLLVNILLIVFAQV